MNDINKNSQYDTAVAVGGVLFENALLIFVGFQLVFILFVLILFEYAIVVLFFSKSFGGNNYQRITLWGKVMDINWVSVKGFYASFPQLTILM